MGSTHCELKMSFPQTLGNQTQNDVTGEMTI